MADSKRVAIKQANSITELAERIANLEALIGALIDAREPTDPSAFAELVAEPFDISALADAIAARLAEQGKRK